MLKFNHTLIVLLLLQQRAVAMPGDAGQMALQDWGVPDPQGVNAAISLGYAIAPDTVDYTPNLVGGGYAEPKSQKRFEGGFVESTVVLNHQFSLAAGYSNHTMTSLRDQFDVDSYHLALQYQLPWQFYGAVAAIRVGHWQNNTAVLSKNSYTRVGDIKMTSLDIVNPGDRQNQMNLILSKPVKGLLYSGFAGVGISRVDYRSVRGTIEREGCSYSFALEKDSGTVEQQNSCGNLQEFQYYMPSSESIEAEIGFNPADYLSYGSTYWQIGGNVAYRVRRLQASVGYYFQQFDRGQVDEDIENGGDRAYPVNHRVSLDGSYAVNPRVSVGFNAQFDSSRLLNDVPFTYNQYTAEKFEKSGLVLSTGIEVRL